mgnify:FL=1
MSDLVILGYPWERIILLLFAACRALVAAGGFALGHKAMKRANWPWYVCVIFACIIAVLFAFLWADGIEPTLKLWIFGYNHNPFVFAIGEWEGYMGATTDGDMATWQRMKCGPPPGGNVDPLLKWWGNPGSGSFCR